MFRGPGLSCAKTEGICTEINPYGVLPSDATLRGRLLSAIALLLSAQERNKGEKAIGSKTTGELLEFRVRRRSLGSAGQGTVLAQGRAQEGCRGFGEELC